MRPTSLARYIAALTLLIATPLQAAPNIPGISPQAPAEEVKPTDILGRETPRGTLHSFLKALSQEDYATAALYLDLSALPKADQGNPEHVVKQLQLLLDRKGRLKPEAEISAASEGKLDDGLAADLESIGDLQGKELKQDILLQRKDAPDGYKIWLLQADFVSKIQQFAKTTHEAPIDKLLIGQLQTIKVKGAPLGQWAAMLGLYIGAYIISLYLAHLLLGAAHFAYRKKFAVSSEKLLLNRFSMPIRLAGMVWLSYLAASFLGLSVIVRHAFSPIGLTISWIAIGLFFWRLADTAVLLYERRMALKERYNMTSVLAFARRTLKFISMLIIIILVLMSFGIDVTAGLAALGIGGIALALGAQKTLENFIGSISIVTDQPFHIGDVCKIGEVTGTVEDIGMRSTRLRTSERTIVTIPNGDLSTQRIENFARRTRLLINRSFVLRFDSKPENIKNFIARCEAILEAEERILQEGVMVRFLGFVVSAGFTVQIWAYVQTRETDEFLRVQADISLKIIEAAAEAGVHFAIPAQTFLPDTTETA